MPEYHYFGFAEIAALIYKLTFYATKNVIFFGKRLTYTKCRCIANDYRIENKAINLTLHFWLQLCIFLYVNQYVNLQQ